MLIKTQSKEKLEPLSQRLLTYTDLQKRTKYFFIILKYIESVGRRKIIPHNIIRKCFASGPQKFNLNWLIFHLLNKNGLVAINSPPPMNFSSLIITISLEE